MREAEAYSRHMNLKLAAHELGMKRQTLYYRLKRAGVPVVGDKLRHGSDRDRLAARRIASRAALSSAQDHKWQG